MNTASCEGSLRFDPVFAWCDSWYSFFPDAVQPNQTEPQNPEYKAGDCADMDEYCYVSSDMTESYAWPGGYTVIYLLEIRGRFHNREPVCCAACAMKAKRAARLKLGDFGGSYADRLVKVHASTYDEGPLLECDGFEEGNSCEDDAVMESSYGDPDDCDVCDGSGKQTDDPGEDCTDCDGTGRKEDT